MTRGLRKSYGGRAAVDDLDLSIHRGEVFALLGPNGAGKTTTVEILEGHRRRDARRRCRCWARIRRRRPRHWRARIGIVLQSATEGGELTVAELVSHFARYYPHPRDPGEVIETVGLAGQARTRLRALSGGQRRRADVALGIIGDPELLFLDEPTTGFDPAARRAFWELISRAGGLGHHDPADHALPGGGRGAGRPGGRARRRPPGGRGHARSARRPRHRRGHGELAGRRRSRARRRTAAPTRLVAELAARFDGEVPGLTVTRPSLEDTYLALIGAPENGAGR